MRRIAYWLTFLLVIAFGLAYTWFFTLAPVYVR